MKRQIKPTRKDFYMEIKKSPGRFLSILFIVALGVAFFSGIRASEPDMRLTGDSYFDESELMDIKALSTYGVTKEDVKALEQVDGVARAEGAYSADLLYNTEDEQRVLHVMSLQKDMNLVTVSKGRMPEKVGECLADDDAGYQIGDTITLSSGTDEPVTDTLKTDTLEVVGLANSPCYLSYGRGSASVGDGSIQAFLVVPEETFALDVYTEVYLQAEGAKELTAFTEAYDDRIEEVLDHVEAATKERAEIRRQEITEEALEELQEAKTKLADARTETESELSDAAAKITQAESELAQARTQLADGRVQIENAKATLVSKQAELDAARAGYESGLQSINNGKLQYEQGAASFAAQKAETEASIAAGKAELEQQRPQVMMLKGLLDVYDAVEAIRADASIPEEEKEAPIAAILENAGVSEEQLNGTLMQAGGAEAVRGMYQTYVNTEAQLQNAEAELQSAENALAQTKAELDAAEAALAAVPEQLSGGQAQIDAGWAELYTQEAGLNSGEAELADGEKELADARKEYEEGKVKAQEELRKAETEIQDAEAEIEKIEEPKWYVYDRSTLIEYSGFGENAERLGAIGQVFPVLFFLVAALISLTSMTRMVEEQRTSIGTMKALGYGKMAIASKYMGYAFLATVGGSTIGVLIGEKILPYIIVYAYGILYRHLPDILIPYNVEYAAIASGAAIFCTMLATLLACYNELGAQPAVLMRPPAPKKGRRVFLERVTFVWRRLNFTWKSTIRNLMRYKKRFFMTIFGIGGCMALMLVGFGLKDSCYEIANLQYADIQFHDGSIYLEEDITEEQRAAIDDVLKQEKDVDGFTDVNMQNLTLVNGKKERAAYEVVFRDTGEISQYVSFHDRRSREEYELGDDGAIITEKTAKLLGVEAGDTIEIKDEENGNKQVKIANICENYMEHYIYMTPAYYEKVYGEVPQYNSIFWSMSDSAEENRLERVGQKVLKEEGVLSVNYTHDIEKQLDDMLRSLNLVIVVLIISAGMLAFVVLYNLNTVNIAERKRELATLKVLGFYDAEVAEYVYRENILLTLLGAAVGVVLGRFLHLYIIQTVEVDSAMFGRNINLPSYLYSLVLTIAFSLLINAVMYFKLKKIDMVESLKSIE